MLKTFVLFLGLILSLNFCEKQELAISNNVASPTPKPVEPDKSLTSANSSLDWENSERFGCFGSPVKNKMWVIIKQTGKLVFTNDDGSTWKEFEVENPKCLAFADEKHGWIVGAGEREYLLLTTDDGGDTWRKKSIENFPPIAEMKFINSSIGWVSDSVVLYQTKDGGNSWTENLSPTPENPRLRLFAQPDTFFFLDEQTGWVCDGGDSSGRIYKTTNGGKTWAAKKIARILASPCELFFINANDGWYSVGVNQSFYTRNGGKTWTKFQSVPKKFEVSSMFRFDANEGWLAGFFEVQQRIPKTGKGAILRTRDGGKTWTEIKIGDSIPFFTKIHFNDSQNGWLLSRDAIYKTSNRGESWNLVYNLPPLK
jgi:photosystem II stability/assembly factor-like uncharacterized protein